MSNGDAQSAIATLNGHLLRRRVMKVHEALERSLGCGPRGGALGGAHGGDRGGRGKCYTAKRLSDATVSLSRLSRRHCLVRGAPRFSRYMTGSVRSTRASDGEIDRRER